MNVYVIIFLVLIVLDMGVQIERHGQPKTGNHNFWLSFFGNCIIMFLLLKGGLFG